MKLGTQFKDTVLEMCWHSPTLHMLHVPAPVVDPSLPDTEPDIEDNTDDMSLNVQGDDDTVSALISPLIWIVPFS